MCKTPRNLGVLLNVLTPNVKESVLTQREE